MNYKYINFNKMEGVIENLKKLISLVMTLHHQRYKKMYCTRFFDLWTLIVIVIVIVIVTILYVCYKYL